MELDRFLPEYDFHEVHSVRVNASPEGTYTATKELTPSDLPWPVHLMFRIRELPAKLTGKSTTELKADSTFLEQLLGEEFMLLSDSSEEIVFGLIGQFWKLRGGENIRLAEPCEFIDFATAGYAKAAANLAFEPAGDETVLSTETRIWAPDEKTRRKFAFYWRLISLGSGWIRIMWLNAIKRRAETVRG